MHGYACECMQADGAHGGQIVPRGAVCAAPRRLAILSSHRGGGCERIAEGEEGEGRACLAERLGGAEDDAEGAVDKEGADRRREAARDSDHARHRGRREDLLQRR